MQTSERNIYLELMPIAEAVDKARAALDRETLVLAESVPANEAAGRVSAGPVHAKLSSPTFHSAAMDGIAVKATDTFGAREGEPLTLIENVTYVPVNTGNPMPEGRDAVIMIEHVADNGDGTMSIEAPAFPWQHVRRIGEDIVATELLFPRNHRFSAYDVGALLGAGVWDLDVWERVRFHIIPTGDEILDFTTRPEPKAGQVVESNSQVLSALARQHGCEAVRVPPVPDVEANLDAAIDQGLASDAHVVIVCAGSSAGSKDYTRRAFERRGEILVHGIKAMPGKPSLLAVAKGPGGVKKLLVGAPGYPVSSVVCFEELVLPLVSWLGRTDVAKRPEVEVELTRKAPSKLGNVEFLRLSVGRVGDRHVATPLGRGAGNISTMSRAQAVTRIPAVSEGLEAGSRVRAELLVPEGNLSRTIVAVGSHDNTLDVLADEMMGLDPALRLASSHVGSMGGLMAVKNGVCHMAGAHLLDPESGDFNFAFIERYLPGMEVVVVNLAIRHQGLIVAPGNPLGLEGVQSLARSGDAPVRFVNRQRGAGTRILLDYYLSMAGISPHDVHGYTKEEFTHMAVAVNVLTGAVDAGLGIYAAARALELDFVPLAKERYDLVIPARLMDEPAVQSMLELIRSDGFRAQVESLGGYETGLTGRVMEPGAGLGEG